MTKTTQCHLRGLKERHEARKAIEFEWLGVSRLLDTKSQSQFMGVVVEPEEVVTVVVEEVRRWLKAFFHALTHTHIYTGPGTHIE